MSKPQQRPHHASKLGLEPGKRMTAKSAVTKASIKVELRKAWSIWITDGGGMGTPIQLIGVFFAERDVRAIQAKNPYTTIQPESVLYDYEDGVVYRLASPDPVLPDTNLPAAKEAARQKALAKLTPADIEALGIQQ
jgi:hypothetical protein